MRKIYKYLLLTMLTTGTLFYSCETTELEDLASPNALSPDQADPALLLNAVQVSYLSGVRTLNSISGDLGRINYMFGRNYFSHFGAGTLNGVWSNLYANMIPDVANIQALHSSDNDLSIHLGMAKALEAHLLMMTVDFLGDVPFAESNNPIEFATPTVDDSQSVYNAALALLDEASGFLNNSSQSQIPEDLYYGGDVSKWIKLVNTLKMRANLTVGNYAAVASATGVIEDTEDDFEFAYGTNELQPDTRHPEYESNYRSDGANTYQSHWLMNLMVGDFGDFSSDTDPRRRYYFFRQNWRTPGNYALVEDLLGLVGAPGDVLSFTASGDGQTLQCSLQLTPVHLQFTPDEAVWCSMHLGYWGRFHGNDEGIPPDNFTRTAPGVYPVAGEFDGVADAFPWNGTSISASFGQSVGLGDGGGGAGIEPIILASYVKFWRAEANLKLGNMGAAANYITEGMTQSIDKVMSFGSKDPNADFSQAPDATTVSDFITKIVGEFNAAPMSTALDGQGYPVAKDKMDILGEQFFVAMYGGAGDAFNFVRRTGYPRTLSRNIEEIPGNFPRTLLYPSNEIQANPNIQQRQDLNTKVFWDSGVLNPAN